MQGMERLPTFGYGLMLVFLVAAAHLVLLALPVYFILRKRNLVTANSSIIVGFIVGATPFISWNLWLLWPFLISGISTSFFSDIYPGVLLFGLCGSVLGYAFWGYLLATGRAQRRPSEERRLSSRLKYWINLERGFQLLVVGGFMAFVVAPYAQYLLFHVEDVSCHNLFRNGSNVVDGAELRVEIELDRSQWSDLGHLLSNFAGKQDLQLRDQSLLEGEATKGLDISLCNESGVVVKVISPKNHNGVHQPVVLLYSLRAESGWTDMGERLVSHLKSQFKIQVN
jgi:hypothetical protein